MLSKPCSKNTLEYPDNPLSAQLVQSGLQTVLIGKNVYYFDSIDSTNRIAKDYAGRNASEGTIIIADMQTSGRGRLDRTWISPPGCNLYCSCIFYPDLNPLSAARITMIASLALLKAITSVCTVDAFIKWPNDIYIQNKKVCGILSEFSTVGDRIAYVVVGIGINVNFDPDVYPEITVSATSLQKACGHVVSRLKLVQSLIRELDVLYGQLCHDGIPNLHILWKQHSLIIDRQVTISSGKCPILIGIARDFNENGHLILEDEQGLLHEVLCGDVSLKIS